MIPPEKLFELEGGQRRRKLALCFGALERDIAGIAEPGTEYNFKSLTRPQYTRRIAEVLLKDPQLSESGRNELMALLAASSFDERRVCNCARNELLKIIGTFPAEWDLVIAPHKPHIQPAEESAESVAGADGVVTQRDFFPGVMVYAEDIRSPFNLGSIVRTAEAFGAEKLFLSPNCTDLSHPRAIRSSMGCDKILSWERTSLDKLPEDVPVFSLETGGTDISEFVFPKKGIVILGSEELGVSPEALKRATYGCVSIPMKGMKASLNVGVAFGILMQAWTSALTVL
ncbi:MAG: TrmH family RNA methyltransferase [Treponema sp.]|nr:TrmH family RNA methyltransferase [Candidatus Treponema caballi]